MQIENDSRAWLLYSLRGFRYCDLLLAAPERAAWLNMQRVGDSSHQLDLVNACRSVSQRAQQTLDWWTHYFTNASLLDIAFDHLTQARGALYAFILDPSSTGNRQSAIENIENAVTDLRRGGAQDFIVRGLLTRAWLRFLSDAHTGPESAQEDLDEAWEIAERGPMRLHMADIHLYRARLFHAVKPYPWNRFDDGREGRGPKDDLDAAEKLINDWGYHRRDEELADAREAAKNWQ